MTYSLFGLFHLPLSVCMLNSILSVNETVVSNFILLNFGFSLIMEHCYNFGLSVTVNVFFHDNVIFKLLPFNMLFAIKIGREKNMFVKDISQI